MTRGQHQELAAAGAAKYGPWAVIAGASDGTGAHYARQLAALGINLLLIARRHQALTELARDLQAKHAVKVRILVQDLMADDAGERILAAAADLDVGLYVSNAGADGAGSAYVESPAERWLNVINMNVRTVTLTTHGFARRFANRGGGILLMSSLAALGGQPWLAMYSATKAFEMVLAEALWAELREVHIDVLAVLAPAMDTPTFRAGIAGTPIRHDRRVRPGRRGARGSRASAARADPDLPVRPDQDEVEQTTRASVSRIRQMAEIGKSLIKPA